MLRILRKIVSDQNPLRLIYHKMIAVIAAIYYGFPANKLNVIAVTGTKGKTTTSNLITKILDEAGHKVGLISTINFKVGDQQWNNTTKQTTASPFVLQKLLRQMTQEDCDFVVLEVSSHALTQSRTWGINIDSAVFTNISNDHLEYHGSFNEYMRAKGTLFKNLNQSKRKPQIQKTSIINHDDEHFDYFDQYFADRKIHYGLEKGTVRASNINLTATGSNFQLHIPNGQTEINLGLPGSVNIYNALAATAAAINANINLTAIKSALEKANQIPGRFEHIKCGQPYSVIVDYAHTTESLEHLLKLYKKVTKQRLFVIFGATGGGRDKAKRPEMGKIADQYADHIILTNDDPYEENQIAIIDQIAAGINRKEGDRLWKITNRREAIRLALTIAKKDDVVIIAGKGCEEVQVIGTKHIPWDDRKVVRELLTREIEIEINHQKVHPPNICIQG